MAEGMNINVGAGASVLALGEVEVLFGSGCENVLNENTIPI